MIGATQNAAAQKTGGTLRRVQLGVRAGVFSQDLELRAGDFARHDANGNPVLDAENNPIIDRYLTESRLGFHVAVASRIRITALGSGRLEMGLYFQPEVVYTQHNYKMQRVSDSEGDGPVAKIRMQSVDIPVLVSFKISIVRAQAGPVFTVFNRYTTISNDISFFEPSRPLIGWTVGASIDIVGGLVLDGRYTGQFKDVRSSITSGTGDTAMTYNNVRGSLSSWSVGLSYMF